MSARRVVAVVPDLLFAARIAGTGRALGVAVEVLAPDAALAALRAAPADLVLLDLAAPGDPLALVRALRADPRTRAIALVGFYPHVEARLREEALAAGVATVLPRSAFTRRLAGLLAPEPRAGGGPRC